ncbi:hypothetical protein DB31_8360 [Hyalangium minutum]|uniref:Uncharacterized protein n=1 Tax=Hyalangium minutum TaxID=394096 RepID=A0A085WH44_9BACT|nr:hypothetical protein DB31_8360 [Hyalangium minutum]
MARLPRTSFEVVAVTGLWAGVLLRTLRGLRRRPHLPRPL